MSAWCFGLIFVVMGMGNSPEPSLGTILFGAALVVGVPLLQAKRVSDSKRKAAAEAAALAQAREDFAARMRDYEANLVGVYGRTAATAILEKRLWLGAPEHAVKLMFQEPEAIAEKVKAGNTTQVFKYFEHRKGQYKLKITLENGFVKEWDDSR